MAVTCEARHAFAYTGHLTEGDTLHRRRIAAILSDGRAWGAGVAAWHAFPEDLTLLGAYQPVLAKIAAHEALRASYAHDIAEQKDSGVLIEPGIQVERENHLGAILDHYMATAEKLPNLSRLEGESEQPIPSRTGKRGSSRYRFLCFIDGFTMNRVDSQWIVEFKLRTSLTDPRLINLSRQVRWYAWNRQQETGEQVVGCYVDERLADAPKSPKLVKAKSKKEPQDELGRRPSHDKDQLCLAEDYIALCEAYDVEPHPETVASLRARRWQQRHPVLFRPSELKEAGEELVSAAKLIRDLDSGERFPIRNAQPQLCRSCRFLEACPNPGDRLYLDTIFERRVPKRLRVPEQAPPVTGDEPVDPLNNGGQPVVPAENALFTYAGATSEEVPWT